MFRQYRIELDGDDARKTSQKVLSKGSLTRTDLDCQRITFMIGGVRNSFQGFAARKKMLAEFLARQIS